MENKELSVLILFGSPHTTGTTAKLLSLFKAKLSLCYPKATFYTMAPYQTPILPCIACGYCKTVEGCTFKDLDEFDQAYRKADLIIVATPVYGLSFPAPLKAIFDRTQRYYEARFAQNIKPSILKPKQAVLLTSFGGESPRGVKVIKEQLTILFSVMNTTLVGEISAQNTDKNAFKARFYDDVVTSLFLDINKKL